MKESSPYFIMRKRICSADLLFENFAYATATSHSGFVFKNYPIPQKFRILCVIVLSFLAGSPLSSYPLVQKRKQREMLEYEGSGTMMMLP
jgi:hypothetical protein